MLLDDMHKKKRKRTGKFFSLGEDERREGGDEMIGTKFKTKD